MPHATLLTLITLVILLIALPLVSMRLGKSIRAAVAAPAVKYLRYARTIVVLWSLTALAWYALRLHNLDPTYVGVRPPRHLIELAAGLITLIAPLLATASGARRVLEGEYARALRAVVPTSAAEFFGFVPVAATAGICEEFLYRGYALTILGALTGSVAVGALLSSIAFGLGHAYQGRAGMLGAIITGLLYSVVFVTTGSLYPCMLGHFVQDIVGALVLTRRLQESAPHAASPEPTAASSPTC